MGCLSANTIMAKLTNQFQQTRQITSSPNKHYSLDSEDDFRSGCRNVSHQQQFSSFQNYLHLDDHTIRTTDTPGFKPFAILRSLRWQSKWLTNNYISSVSTVRQICQQLWFNHCCKDQGLVPAGLKLKSPLNTQEGIQIVKSSCRRLVKAQINDCHRRLNYCNNKLRQQLDKLKQLLPTNLLDTVMTITNQTTVRIVLNKK